MYNSFHKLLYTFLLIFSICVINFFLFQLSPGDPTNSYFHPKARKESLAKRREQLGLNEPWRRQFYKWAINALHGNLGHSWAKHRPVFSILKEAIPATLQLTITALLINFLVGVAAGLFAGVYAQRWWGRALDISGLVFYAIPLFWLALLGVLLFSLILHWLPASGMSALNAQNFDAWGQLIDRIKHLLLPATILGLAGAAGSARYVRGEIQEIFRQNYIKLARAKGLSRRSVYFKHALRNALLPVITLFGLYFPFLLSGALVIEVIFAWPGMGRIAYEAILAKDYPVLMAVNLIAALMVIAGNTLADVLYRFADPRVMLKTTI